MPGLGGSRLEADSLDLPVSRPSGPFVMFLSCGSNIIRNNHEIVNNDVYITTREFSVIFTFLV